MTRSDRPAHSSPNLPHPPSQPDSRSNIARHQQNLRLLLTQVDAIPHVLFGPPALYFSAPLSRALGLPLRPVQYFISAFTVYGGVIFWGLGLGLPRRKTSQVPKPQQENLEKKYQPPPEQSNGGAQDSDVDAVPQWLADTALAVNLSFVVLVSSALGRYGYQEQRLTRVGWGLLSGMVGSAVCVTGGIWHWGRYGLRT